MPDTVFVCVCLQMCLRLSCVCACVIINQQHILSQYHTIVKGALDLLVVFVGYSEVADCPTPRSSPRATPDHTQDNGMSTSKKFKYAVETVSSKKGNCNYRKGNCNYFTSCTSLCYTSMISILVYEIELLKFSETLPM